MKTMWAVLSMWFMMGLMTVPASAQKTGEGGPKDKSVIIEGVAVAKGQPLLFAKRVAGEDAMRTLAEQVAGVDFNLDATREGAIRYAVTTNVAPAGRIQQVSAETLPTGIYRITLKAEVEPAPPDIESLSEIIAEGKGDIAASRSLAGARAAAKAVALAEAVKKAAAQEAATSHRPIPRTLQGHAYYLGPVSERVEGDFYHMTAKFKIVLGP
jgi:hypothetical protein